MGYRVNFKIFKMSSDGKHTETEGGSSTVSVPFGHVFLSIRKRLAQVFTCKIQKIISSVLLLIVTQSKIFKSKLKMKSYKGSS